jgi:hypothetical protein
MAGFIDVPRLNFPRVFPYTRQAAASYSRPRGIAAKGCLGYKSETVHINRRAPETPVSRPPGYPPLIGRPSIWVPSRAPTFGEFLRDRFFRRAALTDVERINKDVVSASKLAKAILADRHTGRESTSRAGFVCCRSYHPVASKGTRFCCRVCRQAYDRGYQPNPQADVFEVPIRDWKILAGPPATNRASHYAPILDKPRKKRSAKKLKNDELIRPRKLCVKCGAKLPVWINGKR